jgi:hypothetical protein
MWQLVQLPAKYLFGPQIDVQYEDEELNWKEVVHVMQLR